MGVVPCSASFMLFFSLLAWVFRLVERDPQTIRRLPKRFRGWMNDVRLVRPPVLPGMPAVINYPDKPLQSHCGTFQ